MPACLLDHKLQMREIKFNYSVCTVQLFLLCFALIEGLTEPLCGWAKYINCFKMAQGVNFNALCKWYRSVVYLCPINNNARCIIRCDLTFSRRQEKQIKIFFLCFDLCFYLSVGFTCPMLAQSRSLRFLSRWIKCLLSGWKCYRLHLTDSSPV